MAETVVEGVWNLHQLPVDLREQANYEGVYINPTSVRPASCAGGTTEGNKFVITWRLGILMMISLLKDEQALIEAFAIVVEYKPFCKYRYRSTGLITYEWAKEDSKGRFAELQQADNVDELQLVGGEKVAKRE